jgi:spore germination protein GerM
MRKAVSLILITGVMILTLGFAGCEKKDAASISNNEKLKNITLPTEKENSVNLNLYFDSSSTKDKVEMAKEERLVNKEELMGEIIMQELLKGPSKVSKLKPILPQSTRLISFSIKEGIAYVSFSSEARITMTPAREEACLRSIFNSLTQLPSISKVKIMIDNSDVSTIGGNYDISKPFGKEELEAMLVKK